MCYENRRKRGIVKTCIDEMTIRAKALIINKLDYKIGNFQEKIRKK